MANKYMNVAGWTDAGMFDVYDEILKLIPDGGIFVEVGCWKGRSSIYLLERLHELKKNISIWFVDTFTGCEYGKGGQIGKSLDEFESNIVAAGFPKNTNWKAVAMDSIEASTMFEKVFAVFLDGNHESTYVRNELLAWKDKCEIVSGHDYLDPPIRRIVGEVLGQVKDFGSSYLYQRPVTFSAWV